MRALLLISFFLPILISCDRNDPQTDGEFRFYKTLTFDGRDRTYLLNLPPDYYNKSAFPLVIAMHGGGGSAEQFERTSLLTEKANAAGFIVVYPDGVQASGPLGIRTWNAGNCCAFARDNNINDVGYINRLIDELVSSYKIDAKSVYATGHSNGGMLAYRLACEIPTKITAIAPNGCTMVMKQPCSPSRPVPVLHMHSIHDAHVPYTGGVGVSNVYYPPLDSVLDAWSLNNSCTNNPEITTNDNYTFKRWPSCNNSSIEFYLTNDGGHAWPGGLPGSVNGDTPSTAIRANDLLWDFFKKYKMP